MIKNQFSLFVCGINFTEMLDHGNFADEGSKFDGVCKVCVCEVGQRALLDKIL